MSSTRHAVVRGPSFTGRGKRPLLTPAHHVERPIGYTRGTKAFDALIFGYYEGEKLIYVARTRNGFTPVTRAQLFKKFKGLEINECPFANLPEARRAVVGAKG
jgi:hypothetical protein